MSSTKQAELKTLQTEKKALAEKQKVIRDELKESAAERAKSRDQRTKGRQAFSCAKSNLRTLLAKSYVVLKDGTSEELSEYADHITELATEMATAARKCSDALEQLEDL